MNPTATFRALAITALLSLSAFPSLAAQCDPASIEQATIGEALECFDQKALGAQAAAEVHPSIVNATNATTPPDAFAGRIHASYQDFFNLLSFAINKVEESEDGQAITVRFNPLRSGRNLLGLSLTAAKPQLSEDVAKGVEALAEDKQKDVTDKLNESLTETDDLTWSLAYSMETKNCALGNGQSRCWGRSDKIYTDVLGALLVAANDPNQELDDASKELDQRRQDFKQKIVELVMNNLPGGHTGSIFGIKLQSFKPEVRAQLLAKLAEFSTATAELTGRHSRRVEDSGLASLFTLVDNQPQLSAIGTYRDFGPLGGQDEGTVALELHWGRMNLNRLFSSSNGDINQALSKLRTMATNGVPTDKFVLTASYKRRSRFHLTDLDVGDLGAGFTPIDLPRTTELKVHAQWGRPFQANLQSQAQDEPATPSPEKARWDFTLDGMRNTKDGIRTQNRWVASYTLTFPVRKQMSFPITINWANEPEFLGMPRRQLSAHFGISYRLPWEPEAK